MNKKYSDILWIAGGQLIGLLSNFLFLKLLTTHLAISEYGYYTLLMSVLLFIRQIVYDPFSIIAAKEAAIKDNLDSNSNFSIQITRYVTDKLFAYIFLIFAMISIIALIVCEIKHLGIYLIIGAIYLGANGAQGVYLNIFNAMGERKWASIGVISDSFVKLILVAAVIFIFDSSAATIIHAVAISSFLVFLWTRNIAIRFSNLLLIDANQKLRSAKHLFILSLPLIAPCILIAVKGVGDKVFMAYFIGIEELAAYNVLLLIGFIPMVLMIGVFQTYAGPYIYKLTATNSFQKTSINYILKIIFIILILIIFWIIISLIFSDFIFVILSSFNYLKYSHFLPYFVLAGALSGISGLLNIGVIGAFKSKIVGNLMLSSILSGMLVLIILIAMYGFEGGVAGLIISNLIMLLIFGTSLLLKKKSRQNI